MQFDRVPLPGITPESFLNSSNSISLEDFLEKAAVVPELICDTETNGEDIRDGRGYCQGVSLAYIYPGIGLITHYLPFRHKFGTNLDKGWLKRFKAIIEFRDHNLLPIIYHNSKFDIVSLETLGITFVNNFHYCTMLIAHLVNENYFSKELDYLTKTLLHDEGKKKSLEFEKIKKAFGWSGIPSEIMYSYAAYDTSLTLRLWEFLKPLFFAESLQDYWQHKLKTIKVVQSMEQHGILIDVSLCERMSAVAEACMTDIVEILELNPASPKDMQTLLIDRLGLPILKRSAKTNKPSFDKEVMEQYDEILERQESTTARFILEYRGWQKSKSSNYDPYVQLLSPDGRLRPNYKLHGTKTGRFSCAKPNLQQIPRISTKPWNGQMKKAFVADEGWELWEGDYSQLEFRLTAAISGEPHLLEIFADDSRDVFNEIAPIISLVRQDTKTFIYATGYGAGINRIHHTLGVSKERAKFIRDMYWRNYPKIKLTSDQARFTALKYKKVKLWSGRYRHFMWPQSEAHKAFNSWVQGGAADIVERTMHRLYNEVESPEVHMLLQVHDSVVFAIRTDVRDKILPEIKRIMEDIQPTFGVRFKVDIHHWGE
jgi:DNA polymerase-1